MFDITNETTELTSIKDIRDELNIVLAVLKEQKDVLNLMAQEIVSPKVDQYKGEYHQEVMKKVVTVVETNIKDVEKMDDHAKNTYDAVGILFFVFWSIIGPELTIEAEPPVGSQAKTGQFLGSTVCSRRLGADCKARKCTCISNAV